MGKTSDQTPRSSFEDLVSPRQHTSDKVSIRSYGPKREQVQIHPNLPNLQEELEKNPNLQVILE